MIKKVFAIILLLQTAALAEEINLLRRRPGKDKAVETKVFNPSYYDSIPDPDSSASDFVPVPDRWSMFYKGKWYDPYNQNVLKGDIPIFGSPGHEWFFEATILSDTLFEHRNVPTAVGIQSTNSANNTDVFGDYKQSTLATNLLTQFALIRGNTVFKPPQFEIRIAPVFNINYTDADETGVLRADPSKGTSRGDAHIGFQEFFIDYHLADISHRYDFISLRAGIQRFISDFRGFVYSDDQPGVRLFGTWDNNKLQYNLAWFSRLDKDVNSGLNTMFDDRDEDVFIANLFRQDAFILGHDIQASIIYREDTAGDSGQRYDENGFLIRPASIGDERPKNLRSTYLGFNTNGHIGRVNTTSSLYYVFGSEDHNPIAGRKTDISAWMTALELSYDIDWMRVRGSFFWASGDSDPFDSDAKGFDAIFDIPNFAGGDLSYWQRQGIPLIGGGGVALVNRLSLLPNLRAGKEKGQSNYVNPGLFLYNLGLDVEVSPTLRLINNISYLHFHHSDTLEAVRQDGSINKEIGFDISTGILYRPFLNNNIQIRAGVAALLPGSGLKNLYGDKTLYDFFTNLIFLY